MINLPAHLPARLSQWLLAFAFEKLAPVTMVALSCSYTTEKRYRHVFLKVGR